MRKITSAPDVGAPDPELENSPIFDHDAEESGDVADLELQAGVCYFNAAAYDIGQYVCSGGELLQCCEGGIWVRRGSCYQG
jgi:hypothetical protein